MSKKRSRHGSGSKSARRTGSSKKGGSQKAAPAGGSSTAVLEQQQGAAKEPRTNRIGLFMAILGIVGLAVSSYLAYAHYKEVSTICLQFMECDEVLSSSYASLYGVPLSVLGLIVYGLVVLLGLLIWRGSRSQQKWFGLAAYVVALSATLWSLYLYYLEIFEIGAFCTWCVVSSIVIFALMVLAVVNVRRLRARPETA